MPITATVAAVATTVAAVGGLAMSGYSAIKSGMEQSKAAKQQRQAYADQAMASRRNQEVAEENARATETAGAFAEKQARIKALKLAGTQAAGFAKAGVLPEGTPLDVMAETAELEEMDIPATRYNYSVQANRYRSQADQYGFEANRNLNISNKSDPNYALGGFMKAGTSLLTTGASLAKTWSF